MERKETLVTFFDLSTTGGKANSIRWGGTCLSDILVGVTINIGLGNRTAASVPIYLAVIVIHIILSVVLIKGVISKNRRFVLAWLGFVAFNLILLNIIYFWLILVPQMKGSFAFVATSNLIGVFYWVWTYSFYLTIPIRIDLMFVAAAAQVHM